MENIEMKKTLPNTEENAHKSRCTKCPSYNECMGNWLDYFSGKG